MAIKKSTLGSVYKQIDAAKNRISKERDKLRDLIAEAEHLAENCETAISDLESAADALSEIV